MIHAFCPFWLTPGWGMLGFHGSLSSHGCFLMMVRLAEMHVS